MIIAIWVVVASSFVISGLYMLYDYFNTKRRFLSSWIRVRKYSKFKYAFINYVKGLLVVVPLLWVLFTIYGIIEFIKNY